jgi:hypothetical protein
MDLNTRLRINFSRLLKPKKMSFINTEIYRVGHKKPAVFVL